MLECQHYWISGPFYITAALTFEEPEYYHPQGIVKVEHCTKCGAIRIPKELRNKMGNNFSQP